MEMIAAAILLEEENNALQNAEARIAKRNLRDSCNPFEMTDQSFKKNFRLNKDAFKYVLDTFAQEALASTLSGVSPLSRVVAALRFFAEGSYQRGVGADDTVGMAQSKVSKSLSYFLEVMQRKLCPQWIRFEMTEEEKIQAKREFYGKTGFPGLTMCVDGTHIKIIKPSEEEFLYYNRNGYFSINAMVVCDNKMRIRFIDAKFPGCNHDSDIWNLSKARASLERKYRDGERNTWLLGDAGYALEPCLMTPYRSPCAGSPESKYNIQHAKTRNIVERTIGVLKNRFRCLLGARELHYSPQKVTRIIIVVCALHNICVHYRVEDMDIHESNSKKVLQKREKMKTASPTTLQ